MYEKESTMKVADIPQAQADNLVSMIDAYAEKGGHHSSTALVLAGRSNSLV